MNGKNKSTSYEKNHPKVLKKLVEYKDWMAKNGYSKSSQSTYFNLISVFFSFIESKDLEKVNAESVKDFELNYIKKNQLSPSYQRQFINTLLLFFGSFMPTPSFDCSQLGKREKKALKSPVYLTEREIYLMIEEASNIKYKTLIALTYSCGLRLSEIRALKRIDILEEFMIIRVEQPAKEDPRYLQLSKKLLDYLREYVAKYRPKTFLFEGAHGGRISARHLQQVVRKTARRCEIDKQVTVQCLRHSYGVHLAQHGVDIKVIGDLMGSRSIPSLSFYRKIAQKTKRRVYNPLDQISFEERPYSKVS